jgi:hypothetical protein
VIVSFLRITVLSGQHNGIVDRVRNANVRPMEPHPWLKPLFRRVGVTVACLAWLGFETYYDMGGLWFWLALGATAYATWDFFLSGSYRNAPE